MTNDLKFKKASKVKKYFDQHRHVAGSKTPFSVQAPLRPLQSV